MIPATSYFVAPRQRFPFVRVRRGLACLCALALVLLAPPNEACAQQAYVRGDASGDGIVDVGDMTGFLGYYFGPTGPLLATNIDALDVNGDGARSMTDFMYLSRFLFFNGRVPPAPYPSPGLPPVQPVPRHRRTTCSSPSRTRSACRAARSQCPST